MKLLTKILEEKLIENFEANRKRSSNTIDHKPVVKFFGGAACTWLVSEYDKENEMFFGLCDLGMGEPELGYISKEELFSIKFPPFGLPVERDLHFVADKTLTQYASEARDLGRIKA
jgi:hypothetical protein